MKILWSHLPLLRGLPAGSERCSGRVLLSLRLTANTANKSSYSERHWPVLRVWPSPIVPRNMRPWRSFRRFVDMTLCTDQIEVQRSHRNENWLLRELQRRHYFRL